jgi:hypothetical protein
MDEKIFILFGLGAIGYLTATNFNDDEDDEDDYHQHHTGLHIHQHQHGNIYQPPCEESYLPVSGMSNTSPSISYTNYPNIPANTNVSPLNFGQMVDIKEDYIPSDYINLSEYGDNPDQIPVYVESTGNVGLPVSDMTDMGADNKYIYDRTLGSIGFTSTKIGGRQRGQADYIRGDLPILPDQGAWFQVSADVVNTLVDGALGNQQALGSEAPVENYRNYREHYAPKMMAMRTVVNEEAGQKFVVDDEVEARIGGSDMWFKGKIISDNQDGTYNVRYDNGNQENNINSNMIRKVLGMCDDEKPDYIACVHEQFKKTGRQPSMQELKRMYALQQQTQNSKLNGYSRQV